MSVATAETRWRPPDPDSIVGISSWSIRIRNEIQVVSRHAATVLVTGPSGTGKELVARWLHAASDRSEQPFVPVDCAVASDSLFASQLFGHEKGAFTGAHHPSLGAFRAADGGTIFLDEIGELDVQLQAKLLRTLQQRVVVPVGGLKEHPIDVRVVAATNRDLREEVAAKRFREDLYYRLNVVSLETQPLCQRREDIPQLINAILRRLEIRLGIERKQVTTAALDALCHFNWPGNVRQLGNVVERAALYSRDIIDLVHLPEEVGAPSSSTKTPLDSVPTNLGSALPGSDHPGWPTMDDMMRIHLQRTLEHTNFNQTAAARMLSLDRNAVRRLAQRLGVAVSLKRG